MSVQGAPFALKASASLHNGHLGSHTQEWLVEMQESAMLLSAMLAVMHPVQFKMGWACTGLILSYNSDLDVIAV